MMYNYNKYRILCKYLALLSLTTTFILVYITKNIQNNMLIIDWKMTENISCHLTDEGDALTSVDESFSPPEKSIFFVETSCRGGLTSRQACAVESAARSNPNRDVHVLFTGPVKEQVLKRSCLSKLLEYSNVKLLRVRMVEYAKGTPLEDFLVKSPYSKSEWRIEHSSDVLRYLTLYKYGGTYMDTDVVVVKNLDPLGKNFAGRESEKSVSAGVISYARDFLGRKMANASIEDFKKNYNSKVWGNNGPGVITRVLKEMCKKKWSRGCNGFTVFEPAIFYPVYYKNRGSYFIPGLDMKFNKKTYVHHLWNALSKNYGISANSAYDILAKKYCPSIRNVYGEHFGE